MRQLFPFLLEMRFGRLDLVARIGDDKDEWWGRDISIYERAAVTGGVSFFFICRFPFRSVLLVSAVVLTRRSPPHSYNTYM